MRTPTLVCLVVLTACVLARAQTPQVASTLPPQNALDVEVTTDVTVTFDADMDASTINDSTFVASGMSSGPNAGVITYDGPSRTATFNPDQDFAVGELVTVVLTAGIESTGGDSLVDYAWSFTTAVACGGALAPAFECAVRWVPSSVFAADLDGDGDVDLVTANYHSDNVSVLLNSGEGTFAPQISYWVGDAPWSVFAGDFDGDGDLDLAVTNRLTDNVSVLLNHGNGTFGPHTTYAAGDEPMCVVAFDADGDGDLDLAATNYQSGNVSVLLNQGNATFATAMDYVAGSLPYGVFAADLDADGDLDLAATSVSSDNVCILLNDGDGTFASGTTYSTGSGPRTIIAFDSDGDGDLDLATASEQSNSISVLQNLGSGVFSTPAVYPAGGLPQSVFAWDVDGDGDLDLAAANYASNNVSVLLNDGSGAYGAQTLHAVGSGPRSVFASDLDGDGDLDLACANSLSNSVSVLSNMMIPHVVTTVPAQNALNVPVSADVSVTFDVAIDSTTVNGSALLLNGMCSGPHPGVISYDVPTRTATIDSDTDFVAGERVTVSLTHEIESICGDHLTAYAWSFTGAVSDGPCQFSVSTDYTTGYVYPISVFASDLDMDGDLDLAVGSYANVGDVAVFLNEGDGEFAPAVFYATQYSPWSVCASDLDGDGDLDLATANLWSASVSVLLNHGDGTFAPHSSYSTGSASARPSSIFAADFDGDGDPDLVTSNPEVNTITVFLNGGDGTLGPPVSYVAGGGEPRSVIAADLDCDGDPDVAVVNPYGDPDDDTVSVLLNDGEGTFAAPVPYDVGDQPHGVVSADLNADGALDLAVANAGDGSVSVLLNLGDGTFGAAIEYDGGGAGGWKSLSAADFDGDGDLDLAVTSPSTSELILLLNEGDGVFLDGPDFAAGPEPSALFAADLDGDGDVDLATGNSYYYHISVLLNEVPSPILSPIPAAIMFEETPMGQTTCDTVLVVNVGAAACSISSISGCEAPPFSLDTSMTNLELAPGDTTEIVVCVTPIGAGPDSCVVTIESNALNSPTVIPVMLDVVTGVTPDATPKPFRIVSVVPNPFNASTTVHFTLPGRMTVSAEVFSVAGGRVRVLVDRESLGPGDVRLTWDGRTEQGLEAASGVYLLRVRTHLGSRTAQAVLLK